MGQGQGQGQGQDHAKVRRRGAALQLQMVLALVLTLTLAHAPEHYYWGPRYCASRQWGCHLMRAISQSRSAATCIQTACHQDKPSKVYKW